nr:AN1-type zinc finger domain-containing protein [Candidatus Njordarchaeota archaeon]
MAKCAECGESVSLPYLCRRCSKYYCAKHRLPESHDCSGLHEGKVDLAHDKVKETHIPDSKLGQPVDGAPRKEDSEAWISIKPYYVQSSYYAQYEARRGKIHFSKTEIQHLLIASVLLILLSLSFMYPAFPFVFSSSFDLTFFIFLTVILFVSFVPHELMHKLVAQRYGLFAEFRIIPSYAMVTLLTIILPVFRIFAPGAVMIVGEARPEAYGKTAAAGPAANVAFGAAMVGLLFIFPDFAVFLLLGVYVSGWLALFNLIPIAPLDGQKILHWNKAAFSILIVASIALFAFALFF